MASISKHPNGRYRARYRDETGQEHVRHFTKRGDAQRWLDQVTASVVTGTYVQPGAGRVTFEEYFAQWAARQVWASGTQTAMSLAVRSTPFRTVQLRTISPTHVEAWVKAMSASLAPSTIKTRYVNVRSVFRAAVRDREIAVDPTDGVRLPRQRKREASMTIPTPDDVRGLLEAADERFVAFLAVAAFAGLRLGEAAALQVGDVDFLRRQLHVKRQVQRADGGQVEIRLPKYGSERTVPAPDRLLQVLSAHIALGHRGAWLFSAGEADPPHQNTVGYWWRKTMAAAGLTGIKLHDLRHFYASGLIASGADVVKVQRALGHASATTTLNTYSHLWPTGEDIVRRAAAALFDEVLPTTEETSTKVEGSDVVEDET